MDDVAEAARLQHAQDRLGRHAVRDRVPVVLHQELGLLAAGAEPGDPRQDTLEIEAEEALAERRARQGDLEDQNAAARLQNAQELAKRDAQVGYVAQRVAHAQKVEVGVGERQLLDGALHEGDRDDLARLAQHANARIEADDRARLAQNARGTLRDHAGARGDVEEFHTGAKPGLLENPAPVASSGAERAQAADEIVMLGGVVEEGVDERAPVALTLVILLEDGMGDRAALGRVVRVSRVAGHRPVSAPPREPHYARRSVKATSCEGAGARADYPPHSPKATSSQRKGAMRVTAAVLYDAKKPVVFEDVGLLEPGPHEVQVRWAANGVCQSDLHVINGDYPHPLPVVLGHEAAGVVEKVGPGVETVAPGDHVCSSYIPSCGKCGYCIGGQPTMCALRDKPRWLDRKSVV